MTIFIGFSAVNTGNNLVYLVTSALLGIMLISGICAQLNLRGLGVTLELPAELFADTDCPVIIRLVNSKRLIPAFLITVRVGEQYALFPFVAASTDAYRSIGVRFARRGRHQAGDIRLESAFPFNLFSRVRKIPSAMELIVFPRPQPCLGLPSQDRQARLDRGDNTQDRPGDDADILSVRDYVVGDPLKTIHWKSTAKTGEFKTKELSSAQPQYVIIDVNRADKADLEHTLSCATFMVLKLIRSNVPVGLSIGEITYKPDVSEPHKLKLLRRLALYDEG